MTVCTAVWGVACNVFLEWHSLHVNNKNALKISGISSHTLFFSIEELAMWNAKGQSGGTHQNHIICFCKRPCITVSWAFKCKKNDNK